MRFVVDRAATAWLLVMIEAVLQFGGNILSKAMRHAHLRAVPFISNPHRHATGEITLAVICFGESVVGKQVARFVEDIGAIGQERVNIAAVGHDRRRAVACRNRRGSLKGKSSREIKARDRGNSCVEGKYV